MVKTKEWKNKWETRSKSNNFELFISSSESPHVFFRNITQVYLHKTKTNQLKAQKLYQSDM